MNKRKIFFWVLVFIFSFILFAYVFRYSNEQYLIKFRGAPVISFKDSIDLNVYKISFERNGLYLNNKIYNAGSISAYSKLHKADVVYQLDEIKSPFKLRKEKNNDTLHIVKDNEVYYLLVTEERR